MAYKLLFDDKVSKDLKKIDKYWQKKILEAIKTYLLKDPYIGKKLVGELSSYYRYRVNDYRVIYEILDDEILLVIIKIKHRKDVYK
ncbi:MAG: type II toxin-antitoxin system RelE/ParE family toxin [Campylobacterota bacterium]|nr:type II toxin-antitoxin system RelE/ParE family toxin [Campylobacterota bacterium]